MYCSIQEAWPEHKFQNHRLNNIEYFKEDNINNKVLEPINKCFSIIEHIESCPNCRNYILQKYGSHQFSKLFETNPQLKETIIIFLIGIVILLILNLLYK